MKESLVFSEIALKALKKAGILSLVRSFLFACFPQKSSPQKQHVRGTPFICVTFIWHCTLVKIHFWSVKQAVLTYLAVHFSIQTCKHSHIGNCYHWKTDASLSVRQVICLMFLLSRNFQILLVFVCSIFIGCGQNAYANTPILCKFLLLEFLQSLGGSV